MTVVQFGTKSSGNSVGKGVLVTDIPAEGSDGRVLRLCNTHLIYGHENASIRLRQLADISSLLKGKALPTVGGVIAGVVGGDMNCPSKIEEGHCRDADVDLNDAWDGTGDDGEGFSLEQR